MFIYELDNWTNFVWDRTKVSDKLLEVTQALGYMHGRLSMIGFDEQLKATAESITVEVVSTSQIEGITLKTNSVRSSVARRLGPNVFSITGHRLLLLAIEYQRLAVRLAKAKFIHLVSGLLVFRISSCHALVNVIHGTVCK